MTKPRVLFLTTSFPTAERPALGVFVLEHARAVAPHADVAVVHLERRLDVRRIEVHADPDAEFPTWHVRYPYRPTLLSAVAHIAAGFAGYRAVRRSGFEPDLIHAHFFLSAVPGALLSAVHRKPLVETEQWTIFLPEDPAPLTTPLRLTARLALRRARLVMPVSESLAGAMRAAGVRGPFRVIPNAVDTSLFHPAAQSSGHGERLVMVGWLHHQKGVDVLLEAIARVRRSRPGLHLDIVGGGDERADFEALTHELGLDDAVTFHGLQPKPAIAELLRDSDLFVLASRFDNNPCVLVEAQASGLPIVATRVGGIPEIVDGAGLISEPEDPVAFAAQVGVALGQLDSYDGAAIAARARARYDLAPIGEAFAEVYRAVLAGTL